jgi:hypothetical protein
VSGEPKFLFEDPQAWSTAMYRERMAFVFLEANKAQFRADFAQWLRNNYAVWRAFEREADAVWDRGYRHYSARTIGEFLRHRTMVAEAPNALGFKLNNCYFPDLARLYLLFHPDRDGFFEKRVNPLSVRGAA